MRSRVLAQTAAAAMVFGGLAGVAVAAAPPAAAIQQCQSYQRDVSVTVSQPPNAQISVNAWDYCIPGPGGIAYPITISKYIGNNVWQVVASGKGDVFYSCTGGRFVYITNFSSSQFYCG